MVVAVLYGFPVRRDRAHHGQSLVEFALILPILALLVLGAVDLTRAFYYYIALENASRETARVLIDFPYWYDDSVACRPGPLARLPSLDARGAADPPACRPSAH